jgi:hypothetical protein
MTGAWIIQAAINGPRTAGGRSQGGHLFQVQGAMSELDPLDREVAALRHFRLVSPAQAARVVGIAVESAETCHVWLEQEILAAKPGSERGPPIHVDRRLEGH